MRARLASLLALGAVVLVVIVASGAGGSAARYRVAAQFDSAEGIVPGQLVKIAGAQVGTISAVRLEPGPTALIEFSVPNRFGPFHTDARCQILPEGLISENYVQCTPGSPTAPVLGAPRGRRVPTVPLAHTTVPVSLQQVLDIFSLPVSQRLSALIGELGIGTAGRGQDINAILRRADPALTQADRMLAILNAQDRRLGDSVTQMRSVIGALAANSTSVKRFIDGAARVAATTAARSSSLAQAVARLPTLLGALRRDLAPVDRVAVDSPPLLRDLRSSAGGLLRLNSVVPAFAAAGLPAVRALARVTARGLPALRSATGLVDQVARLGPVANLVVPQLDRLLVSTRDSGAFEGLWRLGYSLATDSANYDSTSHYVTALIIPFATCLADAAAPGCRHGYDAPRQGAVPVNASLHSAAAGALAGAAGSHGSPSGHTAGRATRSPSMPSAPPAPGDGAQPGPAPDSRGGTAATTSGGTPGPLGSLLRYLLR